MLALPAAARADADPASDFLLFARVYFPYSHPLPQKTKQQLTSALDRAAARGRPIRMALIGAPIDLGGVGSLWRKPHTYARFLGQELAIGARDKSLVIVVMPSGFGLYAGEGVSTARERRALRGVATSGGAAGLAQAGLTAVERLGGVRASGGGSAWRDRAAIALGALALLALGAAATLLLRRRR